MMNINLRTNGLWEKISDFLNEKIEENNSAIENEKLWAKGSDAPEQASLHEGNIEELAEYNDILQYAINYGKIVCDKEIHMIWIQQLFEEYKEVLIDLDEKFGWRYYNEDYIEAVDEILADIAMELN